MHVLAMLLPQKKYVPPPPPLAMVFFTEPGGQLTLALLQLAGRRLQQPHRKWRKGEKWNHA